MKYMACHGKIGSGKNEILGYLSHISRLVSDTGWGRGGEIFMLFSSMEGKLRTI